jgi:hypothetical protein
MSKTRIEICDRCKNQFRRKWSAVRQDWSQINDINYWTAGKVWNNWKIVCRECLNYWFTKESESWNELISPSKKNVFYTYRSDGFFSSEREKI